MSKDLGTLPQAAHLLKIITEQDLMTSEIETLHPLVSALARSVKNGIAPTLDDLQKFLGLSLQEFQAVLESGVTIEQLIASARFNRVNPDIASNFPINPKAVGSYHFKLCEPKKSISAEAVRDMMIADGFPPARHEAGIAFARKYPREQLKRPIALLGSFARVRGGRFVVCLDGDGSERDLCLYRWGGGWDGRWGFLGAQQISAA